MGGLMCAQKYKYQKNGPTDACSYCGHLQSTFPCWQVRLSLLWSDNCNLTGLVTIFARCVGQVSCVCLRKSQFETFRWGGHLKKINKKKKVGTWLDKPVPLFYCNWAWGFQSATETSALVSLAVATLQIASFIDANTDQKNSSCSTVMQTGWQEINITAVQSLHMISE